MNPVNQQFQGQLPRGRHGLSRETVEQSQRERIHAAMIQVVARRGYSDARVVDAIDVAGVSRKTFYELFEDKEDCFLSTYDLIVRQLLEVTGSEFGSDPEASWSERIRHGLAAMLDLIVAQPDAARFCIVEVLAAGPKALARRDAAIRQFTYFLDAGRSETSLELPGITSLAIAGGINELLYSELIHGAAAQLPTRLPDLVFWITSPFLGPEKASVERDLARHMLAQRKAPVAAE